jgi:hypothetical protein
MARNVKNRVAKVKSANLFGRSVNYVAKEICYIDT